MDASPRSRPRAPTANGKDRVEIWDAHDFAPWESLRWDRVRVIHYRQHKAEGTVIQAEWLTNFSLRQIGSLSLYHIAKSRWEIENQGSMRLRRYGLEHICHHEQNSMLLVWLITFLAIILERLYRIRYLHRGTHRRHSADQLCRLLWLHLFPSSHINAS